MEFFVLFERQKLVPNMQNILLIYFQCGEEYVGETIRNTAMHWSEHNNPKHKSESAQHTEKHIEHLLDLSILCKSHLITELRKTLKHCLLVL